MIFVYIWSGDKHAIVSNPVLSRVSDEIPPTDKPQDIVTPLLLAINNSTSSIGRSLSELNLLYDMCRRLPMLEDTRRSSSTHRMNAACVLVPFDDLRIWYGVFVLA